MIFTTYSLTNQYDYANNQKEKHIKDAKPSFITSCAQQAQKAMNYIIEESLGLEK